MLFTSCEQPLQRFYWPENTIEWWSNNVNDMSNGTCVDTNHLSGSSNHSLYTATTTFKNYDYVCTVITLRVILKYYNIALVNSERSLANSHVDIIRCQYGKYPVALLFKLFYIFFYIIKEM